jgi:hypothetical protein
LVVYGDAAVSHYRRPAGAAHPVAARMPGYQAIFAHVIG